MKILWKSFLWTFGFLLLGLAIFIIFDPAPPPETAGEIVGKVRQHALVKHKRQTQQQASQALAGAEVSKQVLFGDLHVHSTFSLDAFSWGMPAFMGEGLHPPADACDYARYCSAMDFWAITDHAEALTPEQWQMQKDNIRACDAVAGDSANPDMVSFIGWEWTHMATKAEDHYGHKNVILYDTADDKVPARPIGALGLVTENMREQDATFTQRYLAPFADFANRNLLRGLIQKRDNLKQYDYCESGTPSPDLPKDCLEMVETPAELFRKLDEWQANALVIPHGNAWGYTTPMDISWDKQLKGAQHDPKRQNLIEVFSGHGNSEEYRDFRHIEFDANGQALCPAATDDFLPCCQRAGQIIQERCDDPASADCQAKTEQAKADYLYGERWGHLSIAGIKPDDWLNCGQCTDCYLPAFSYRPGGSSQYALAISNFDETDNGQPRRFRFGFIGSSDNHSAQPGTGYKEVNRHKDTDVYGPKDQRTRDFFFDAKRPTGDPKVSHRFDPHTPGHNFFQISESERLGSFFFTGGLIAVHADGRDRKAIWDAMQHKEVYGTSGERHLLWFDLINAPNGEQAMGSETVMTANPKFRVRAIGAFEQAPGCPDVAKDALGEERLEFMCGGECYNPTDQRQIIDRIEVIRIKPQISADEDVANLIEDTWKTFHCSGDERGCQVEFEDPDYAAGNREHIYYVRALTKPRPTVNAGMARCEEDENGQCLKAKLCSPAFETDRDDNCLAAAPERAWSSPIFVRPQ